MFGWGGDADETGVTHDGDAGQFLGCAGIEPDERGSKGGRTKDATVKQRWERGPPGRA